MEVSPYRHSILRRRMENRQPILCFKSNIPSPMIPELLGWWGMDCLWLDCEHFPTSVETMALLVQACRASDTDSVVRVPNREFALAAKMFDLGADAVMYPRCRTADEVAELIQWVRFPPVGRRGADTGVMAALGGSLSVEDSLARARRETSVLIQIETREALDALDAIAAVPGIDILFVGPGDLAVDLGLPCDPHHPVLADAIRRVAEAARRHDLQWGMPAFSPEHAGALLTQGARFIAHGSDTAFLRREITALRERFAKLQIPFGA